MESILAAISTLAILGSITAWVFAWKINNDWAEHLKRMNSDWRDLCQTIYEKEKERADDGRE